MKSDLNARFDFTAMLLIVSESAPSLTIKHYVKVCWTKEGYSNKTTMKKTKANQNQNHKQTKYVTRKDVL